MASKQGKAKKTSAPINGPHPGCCLPYPDIRFVNGDPVTLHMHHKGPLCAGSMTPVDLKAWLDEVISRERARASAVPVAA